LGFKNFFLFIKFMIDREQVHKVALLARLELSSAEEEQFTTQLGSILDYFAQLSELDVTDVPPTTRAIDVSNVTRSDDLQPYSDRESILTGAPDQEGEFFKVPQILSAVDSRQKNCPNSQIVSIKSLLSG
jgi:aspartyl-tRNA(Asn)/glutamyl-tRNA(Gln) amidotransferase subunit C